MCGQKLLKSHYHIASVAVAAVSAAADCIWNEG
jgi:hypothetical protein